LQCYAEEFAQFFDSDPLRASAGFKRSKYRAAPPIRFAELAEISPRRHSSEGLLLHGKRRAIDDDWGAPAPGEIRSLQRYDPT
jgi:hypothetical protein